MGRRRDWNGWSGSSDPARWPGYHLLPAAQADLLRRLGRTDEARVAYRRALELVRHPAERRFLERRLVRAWRLWARGAWLQRHARSPSRARIGPISLRKFMNISTSERNSVGTLPDWIAGFRIWSDAPDTEAVGGQSRPGAASRLGVAPSAPVDAGEQLAEHPGKVRARIAEHAEHRVEVSLDAPEAPPERDITRARAALSARDTVDLCVPTRRPISSSVSPSST